MNSPEPSPDNPIASNQEAQSTAMDNSNAAQSLAEVQPAALPPEPNPSMQEYFQLQQSLLKVTLILTGIIFISVWIFYSLNIALNYLIGACTGVVYLKMLARNVEQLGRQKKRVSKTHLALFVGVIVTASQVDQLQILPIFLGFLTYKAAILFYMFRTLSTQS